MKRNNNIKIIALLVFASFFINVYTFTSLSHLFKYILNFEIIRRFDEIVTYNDWMFLKRFLMYFFTSSISGITVFFINKKLSVLNISKQKKIAGIVLTISALTALSIALHLTFIERHGWDFDISYEEYIFRRIMWYIGRTVSISFISLYMAYFAIQKNKDKKMESDIHELRISNIKNKYLVLKEQINPNFLFNSVNTLNKLILEDSKGARIFLTNLSRLLRNSISHTQLNSVEKEVELINSLIIIYKYESDTGFKVQNNISSDIYNYQIPTLIISNILSIVHKRHLNFHHIFPTQILLLNDELFIYIEIISKNIEFDLEFNMLCKQLSDRHIAIKNTSFEIASGNNYSKLSLPL